MKCFLFFVLILCCKISIAQNNEKLLEYMQDQRFTEAAELMKTMYPEPVSDHKILNRMGYCYLMAGKLPEAESYYNRVMQKDSANIGVLFNLASISSRKGNFQQTGQFYQKIVRLDSTNFAVYKQLANLSTSVDNLKTPFSYLLTANCLNPADPDVAFDLSEEWIAQNRFSEADKVLTKALEADSSNLILLGGKANLLFKMKRYADVTPLCEKLILAGEQSLKVRKMLGQSYYEIKQYQKCINTFKVLEENAQQNESTLYYTAMSYKMLKDYQQAVSYIKKTIDEGISKNVGYYYTELGDNYESMKQTSNSLFAYQKSLQFDEKRMTYYLLAQIYDDKLKDKKQAIRYYQKFLSAKSAHKPKEVYTNYARSRVEFLAKN